MIIELQHAPIYNQINEIQTTLKSKDPHHHSKPQQTKQKQPQKQKRSTPLQRNDKTTHVIVSTLDKHFSLRTETK